MIEEEESRLVGDTAALDSHFFLPVPSQFFISLSREDRRLGAAGMGGARKKEAEQPKKMQIRIRMLICALMWGREGFQLAGFVDTGAGLSPWGTFSSRSALIDSSSTSLPPFTPLPVFFSPRPPPPLPVHSPTSSG